MIGARKRILRESIPTSESSSEVMRIGGQRKTVFTIEQMTGEGREGERGRRQREMETNI
jgi:hypothetical protein